MLELVEVIHTDVTLLVHVPVCTNLIQMVHVLYRSESSLHFAVLYTALYMVVSWTTLYINKIHGRFCSLRQTDDIFLTMFVHCALLEVK